MVIAQVASHYLHNPGWLLGPLAGVSCTPEVVSIRFSRRNVALQRRL